MLPSMVYSQFLLRWVCILLLFKFLDGIKNFIYFFLSIGVVPVIRSPRGNAAEMVAEKLTKKLRENLRDTRNSLFLAESSYRYYNTFEIRVLATY